MTSLLFIDSAYPLGKVVPGVAGIAFYVGGDTPHVWTKAEVDAEPYRFRLPIFVRSNPPGPGAAADVAACVTHLEAIGCPKGVMVAWDMETSVDAAYMTGVYDALRLAGYRLIVYASQSFIASQGNPDGLYWGAQWTGAVHIATGDVMTQYADFGSYDESDTTLSPALPFWDTKAVAPPPAIPPPSQNPWPLQAGSNGPNVMTLQRNLNRWGDAVPALATDGAFGPLTLGAVRHAQARLGKPVTGIADEFLWTALAAPLTVAEWPVPSGISAAVHPTVVITWLAGTPVSPHWRLQVAADNGGTPGLVIAGGSVLTTVNSATLTLPHSGTFWAQVQAAGNGAFSRWQRFNALWS